MSLLFDTLRPRGLACIVDIGCSAMVSIYMNDEHFVLKGSKVWLNSRCYRRTENIDSKTTLILENTVYQRLGLHPHILKYDSKVLVREDTYSLKLEQALGNLQKLIFSCPALTEHTRLKMAVQILHSMVYVHSRNVFHCDFTCHNVLVFTDWLLKIGDFGGSKINDQEPLAGEEIHYQLLLYKRK
jgi:serine/threonine protein kinase